MGRQTPLLLNPTLDEVLAEAKRIELPAREAEKFYFHYESNGWKVGKNPMKSWRGALMGWKLRWQDRSGAADDEVSGPIKRAGLSAGDRMIFQKELERILEKMRTIRARYTDTQTWTKTDREVYPRLVRRRDEVKKLLGLEF